MAEIGFDISQYGFVESAGGVHSNPCDEQRSGRDGFARRTQLAAGSRRGEGARWA